MIKLFCIPHSGASAAVYSKWSKLFQENIQVVPIELAGHGTRINETCYKDVESSAKDIAQKISGLICGEDYAIWGHSLGSLLAFETYYQLMELNIKKPLHMFFSGRKAPNDGNNETHFYQLPDDEFAEAVETYGGTTKEVFDNEILKELFLPILRADFEMGETYKYKEKERKIACDITIVNGKDDLSVSQSDMKIWNTCNEGTCNIKYYNGGHFYLFESCEEVIKLIQDTLVS